MFKGLGNFASLLRQAQEVGSKMQQINEQLKSQRAVGKAGAGLVEVEVNGLGEMLRLKIDPSLLERGELEMIEDLVPAAVNEAQTKARQLHSQAMQSMTAGLDLPGLNEALSQLAGGQRETD